jgi:pilus assembly protein CpaE
LSGSCERACRTGKSNRTSARAGDNPSSLVSFVPSAGGVGNTTLVVEAAVQIKANRATRNRRVCVIDLDFQTSHICDHLDIEPRLQIQEIVDDPQRFDDQMFEVFVSRHSSGIDVLAAPRSKTFNAAELRIETLDVLFDKMAARYEYMLADLPVTWFSWTRPVIGASSRMVVTGLNTVPGLRQIAETLAVIRGNAADGQGHIAVAINRCQRRSFNGTALRESTSGVFSAGSKFCWCARTLPPPRASMPASRWRSPQPAQGE